MPRPKTKRTLEQQSQKNFQRLMEFIQGFSEEERQREFPEGTMNRNIRDVLGHLHHWHLLFLKWYEVGMKGEKPAMPAEGYTWKMNSQLNHWIWEQYRKISLVEVISKLRNSHQQMQGYISVHTEEELFEKKRYKWTGSTSLAAYLISATSSHYDWAYKLIKKAKKSS